ncbi:MAG: hypothetical protein ACLFTK_15760, partial [Anaerolineales bacterium]
MMDNAQAQPVSSSRPPTFLQQLAKLLPGLVLSIVVAWLGLQASVVIGETILGFENSPISGIMMAIIFGL